MTSEIPEHDQNAERIAILGAGRGLGFAIAQKLAMRADVSLLLISKHASRAQAVTAPPRTQIFEIDFTHENAVCDVQAKLANFRPTRIWYVAGGGPFGAFADKEWKDHLWALRLNLLFPLELFHACLRAKLTFAQWVFVGSAIAENKAEIQGLSYGAAKQGLRSAWESWRAETDAAGGPKSAARANDVRLYSPGYIDTGMLPPQAWPRTNGAPISSLASTAEHFIAWTLDLKQKNHHYSAYGSASSSVK